jgi:adenine-specific DNA methylase
MTGIELTELELDFPAESVSHIAQKESWRKEIYNPASSTHKWWAKRLGSVYSAIIKSANTNSSNGQEITQFKDLLIFDPFAGSGTTCVEGLKLGSRVIGYDINPVANLVQRQAVSKWSTPTLLELFERVSSECKQEIDRVHKTEDGRDVLYYFWVGVVECPECELKVRLFNSPIFSRDAYPDRKPQVQLVCSECLAIKESVIDFDAEQCPNGHAIGKEGAVKGSNMVCGSGHISKIVSSLKNKKPEFELYAKISVNAEGNRLYESISQWDRDLYNECKELLQNLQGSILPSGSLEPGINTAQAMKWGYLNWIDFFNDRQLYSLSLIAKSITGLPVNTPEREALSALFSGTLEFNNLFCSFKGEGTGAVRHMFANHVLKPERTPLEAHPWGRGNSSGSFSTLFKSRILKADTFKKSPSLLVDQNGSIEKQLLVGSSLEGEIAKNWKSFDSSKSRAYLASSSSSETDIPDKTVDLVVTDPPYMDNVHYAELADFFHAWLKNMDVHEGYPKSSSTRSDLEVQQADPADFGLAIQKVWSECNRVLKDDGLLVFSFHQARIQGWGELILALFKSGFSVTAIQPIKGEMSTSIVKSGANEPSNLDSIIVCRKRQSLTDASVLKLTERSFEHLKNLAHAGIDVGVGDVRSVLRGSLIAEQANKGFLDFDYTVIDQLVFNLMDATSSVWTTGSYKVNNLKELIDKASEAGF